ncbi:MAG: complex I subunit 5 family protein [bacterium]
MHSPALLVVLPFAGAAIALLGKLSRRKLLFSVLSVTPLAAMGAVLARQLPAVLEGRTLRYALGGWPEPYGIALVMNGLAWLMSALIVGISTMVVPAALARTGRHRPEREDEHKGPYGPVFFFFLMTLIAGMQAVALTGDIFTMFVAFEIVAIAAYVLIAFDRTDAGLLASLKYLILSSVGILFFLFGVFLVYRDVGTLSLEHIGRALAGTGPGGVGEGTGSATGGAGTPADALLGSTSIRLAVVAMVVGIGVRTAFIPFHTWLPEAHAYAPHPVSALLSGVLIKISFFAMVRILATFSGDYLSDLLLWVGGITAVVAVIWALAQSDAKRLLAYHSISQMGYVLAAFGAATTLSLPAALAHAVNHALFKSLLFLVVGSAIAMTGERNLYRMAPIGRRAPILAIAFLAGALSIAGIPPFNGFTSKQFVSAAVYGSPVYVLLWVTAAGTTASFIKLSRIVRPGPSLSKVSPHPTAPEHPPVPDRPGFLIHVPTLILAGACLVTGPFARPLVRFYARLLESVPHMSAASRPTAGSPAVESAIATLPELFGSDKLLDTTIIVAVGIVLYFLTVSKPGKSVAIRIERSAPEVRTVLVFFFIGLGVFGMFALL